MAEQVILPRQGNTVESCIILEWKKSVGDAVSKGDVLCEVETDKATFEVESTADGVLLAAFFEEGADVPVLTAIAAVGAEGEDVEELRPGSETSADASSEGEAETSRAAAGNTAAAGQSAAAAGTSDVAGSPGGGTAESPDTGSSPRARRVAAAHGLDTAALAGSGPHGRVIERDVTEALANSAPVSPAAQSEIAAGGAVAPARGSGIGGRVRSADLASSGATDAPEYSDSPVRGVRKRVAEKMRQSLSESAQLTMHASADARAILRYRRRIKEQGEALGIGNVTLNDIVMYAAVRALERHPELNAHFLGDTIRRFSPVHLGFAVDTPRGLLVPVIDHAETLTLASLAAESARLAASCNEGNVEPDSLSGGTFTVTNLGSFGIEYFTPVLNLPQVAILGVNTIKEKPVRNSDGEIEHLPHLGLSLTIDHQAVDGAPAARFLKELAELIGGFDLALAM